MAEFFLELFSEEIPANLQKNFREKLLEEFREYFINKSIKSKKVFHYQLQTELLSYLRVYKKKLKLGLRK